MVSEMNKKLGANISRSELAALRTQVESPTANERLIMTSCASKSTSHYLTSILIKRG